MTVTSEEVTTDGRRFKVVCAWCGAVIRHSARKDSQGMCPNCHARMLSDYNRAHAHAAGQFKASER